MVAAWAANLRVLSFGVSFAKDGVRQGAKLANEVRSVLSGLGRRRRGILVWGGGLGFRVQGLVCKHVRLPKP